MDEGWKPYAGTAPVFEQGTNFTKVDSWLSAEETKGGHWKGLAYDGQKMLPEWQV